MPRRVSAAEVEAALRRIGIRRVRQRGSHITLSGYWRGVTRNVQLIATEKVIPARRMNSVLHQSALTAEEMLRLIEREDVRE